MRKLILALGIIATVGLAACGDDSDSDTTTAASEAASTTEAESAEESDASEEAEEAEEAEASSTPEDAIAEIAEVRKGLELAGEQYADGDAESAEETVSETYLQHFELVEGPLGEVDPELNEQLEVTIRETLRDQIAGGAPVEQVDALIADINDNLDAAEKALESAP